jgi:hypothetical protein
MLLDRGGSGFDALLTPYSPPPEFTETPSALLARVRRRGTANVRWWSRTKHGGHRAGSHVGSGHLKTWHDCPPPLGASGARLF